jgi:hypothetical protein
MKIERLLRSKKPVWFPQHRAIRTQLTSDKDAKAKAEMAAMAKGSKGPLNTGSQGIKKSGKK